MESNEEVDRICNEDEENPELADTEDLYLTKKLIDQPFSWETVYSDSAITLIIAFSIFYFILEVNEIASFGNVQFYKKINNYVEFLYIFIVFLAIILHMIRFRWNRNSFYSLEFDNYPMLLIMLICALIDIVFYFMNFISIATECNNYSRIYSTLAELLFVTAIFPFVIICVCNNIRPSNFVMEIKTKVTLLLAISGCMVLYMRKVTIKIEKDFNKNATNYTCNNTNLAFIHRKVVSAENILELVDLTYILIAMIFLIDPFRRVAKLKSGKKEINFNSISLKPFPSILGSLSLVRFRWVTVVVSITSVAVILVESFVITEILDSKLDEVYKKDSLEVYLLSTIAIYIIGIFYGTVYYFFDIKRWPEKTNVYIRNDEHFNKFSSSFQILYAGGMILSLVYLKGDLDMQIIKFLYFFFLSIQILVQAGCIDAVIRRDVVSNKILNWRSVLYPPVALTCINFGFMIISMIYSKNSIFISDLKGYTANKFVYVAIKDIALPITILNRLHSMTFFMNLSIQQWHEST